MRANFFGVRTSRIVRVHIRSVQTFKIFGKFNQMNEKLMLLASFGHVNCNQC